MKSKKILALCIMLFLVSCFSITAFASENEGFAYTVESTTSNVINEGETVTLVVTVSQNSGIKYNKIDVTFNPESLEYVGHEKLVEDDKIKVVETKAAEGKLVIVIGNAADIFNSDAKVYTVTGELFKFNFVAKEAYDGETEIGTSVNSSNFYDKDGNSGSKTDYVVEGEAEEIYVYNPDPEVHTHIWQDATCLVPQTCVMCQATSGSALGHSFVDYVSDGNATCENDGTKTAKCDRCEVTDTVTDEGSAIGHAYSAWTSNGDGTHTKVCANAINGVCECEADTVTVECAGGTATCESKAICADCKAEYGEILGHKYGIWISQKDGTHIRFCENDNNHTETEKCYGGEAKCEVKPVCEGCKGSYGEALVHVYTNYVSDENATCEADGTKTAACDNGCGTKDTVADEGSALGHKYTNYVSDGNATCEADGTKTATCDNGCGTKDTVADEGSALGHKYTNYVSDGNATCEADGTKTATCDNGCGTKDTVADEGSALGHTPGEAATCVNAQLCTVCNKELEAAKGHVSETIPAVEPTYSAEGSTAGSKCSVCGEILEAPEVIEKKSSAWIWITVSAVVVAGAVAAVVVIILKKKKS